MYRKYSFISEVLGVPEKQLQSWSGSGRWYATRKQLEAQMIKEAIQKNKAGITAICGLSVEVLRKQLQRMVARDEELSMKEAKFASDILANIDRINRLDSSKPTEIIQRQNLTPKAVEKKVREIFSELDKLDPMYDYEKRTGKGADSTVTKIH